jgi:hypothetical protein
MSKTYAVCSEQPMTVAQGITNTSAYINRVYLRTVTGWSMATALQGIPTRANFVDAHRRTHCISVGFLIADTNDHTTCETLMTATPE